MPAEFCPRQIVFELPGSPGVLVTATEDGSGGINFIVDVVDGATITGDLRALFLDINEAKLGGLEITDGSGLITETMIDPNNVLDLGNGANLKGTTKDGFDIGIEWGTQGIGHDDDIHEPVSFTLTNEAGDLTLDDIAHQRFGARVNSAGSPDGSRSGSEKLLVVAPAAPDANDDSYDIFEDNSAGLNDPSKTPTNYVMNVLANDTDGDGDTLTIISIHEQPDHGTVSITDGGTTLTYTPELDYAGEVTFEYCVSDGDGGQDHALVTLTLEAVADDPLVTITAAAGDEVNEIVLTVTAEQDDADSSEFIADLLAGSVPAGSTLVLAGVVLPVGDDTAVSTYLLTVPLNQDSAFDLVFTATSEEVTNGDQETNSGTISIEYDYNETNAVGHFTATDQSMWDTGGEYTLDDERFIGIDTGEFDESIGGAFYAGVSGHIKLGFQSDLHFEGGEIDAQADYDINVKTNYNRTVDLLRVDIATALAGASFTTEGPEGTYDLDFLWDIYLNAYAGVDVEVYSDEISLGTISVGPGSLEILSVDSDTLGGSFALPPPLNAFSVNYAWPQLSTSGSFPPNPFSGSGASNNFLELNLDVDELVSQIAFGGVNPFDPPQIGSVLYADFDLLDVDLIGGLNFLQKFTLFMDDLVGTLVFEDGSNQAFDLGVSNLLLPNASAIDLGGDGDGLVEFTLYIGPEADLTNNTDLGFNISIDISLLEVEIGYDIEIASDSTTLGPLAEFGETWPIGDIDLYDNTFALNFTTDSFSFGA
jgi:hypothetical protein